jgi:hypothetical protein
MVHWTHHGAGLNIRKVFSWSGDNAISRVLNRAWALTIAAPESTAGSGLGHGQNLLQNLD